MFFIESNPAEETQAILKRVKKFLGEVPPHFELFATLNPKRFEMFINEIFYLAMHKSIHPDFFALMRFYISTQEGYNYCREFNHALLVKKGYSQEALEVFKNNPDTLPMDERHQVLFTQAILALQNPQSFGMDNTETLENYGWTHSDIFDAIDHGAFLYRFSKILKAYAA